MSKYTGGFAFPVGFHPVGNGADQQGMTLRDYFAAKAMQGMLSNGKNTLDGEPMSIPKHIGFIAYAAYEQADAMLAERNKT